MRRRRLVLRAVSRASLWIALGAVATAAVSMGVWWFTDPTIGGVTAGTSALRSDHLWSVQVVRRTASVLVESIRDRARGHAWTPHQAIGPPDTPGVGDMATAWASLTPDGQREWLLLDFGRERNPMRIEVHATYNPGAIDRVTGVTDAGYEFDIWTGVDPLRGISNATVSTFPVQPKHAVRWIRLHLNSPAVAGWNEIDAVGLVTGDGTIWAVGAEASSTYAAVSSGGVAPEVLTPGWSGFQQAGSAFRDGSQLIERRLVAGYGWPLPAFATFVDVAALPPGAGWGRALPTIVPATVGVPIFPLWPGLLVDAAACGAALWLLSLMCFRPVRMARELLRMRRGCCPRCGYDLRYDFARGCSECGLIREADGTARRS